MFQEYSGKTVNHCHLLIPSLHLRKWELENQMQGLAIGKAAARGRSGGLPSLWSGSEIHRLLCGTCNKLVFFRAAWFCEPRWLQTSAPGPQWASLKSACGFTLKPCSAFLWKLLAGVYKVVIEALLLAPCSQASWRFSSTFSKSNELPSPWSLLSVDPAENMHQLDVILRSELYS